MAWLSNFLIRYGYVQMKLVERKILVRLDYSVRYSVVRGFWNVFARRQELGRRRFAQ